VADLVGPGIRRWVISAYLPLLRTPVPEIGHWNPGLNPGFGRPGLKDGALPAGLVVSLAW
jgi:hypothetical protein